MKNDPFWMTARYAGTDANGAPFAKGARVWYYPKGRRIYSGADAERRAAEFFAAAADESWNPCY